MRFSNYYQKRREKVSPGWENHAPSIIIQLGFNFYAFGFFNEADTLESSSILIYSFQRQGILYTEIWQEAILIKMKLELRGDN